MTQSRISRRRLGGLLLSGAAGTTLGPTVFARTARAQIARGAELVVGIWGGAQERIVREHCQRILEERHGARISYVLGGTVERRARAYAERGRPSFDIVYLNIFESRQAVPKQEECPSSRSGEGACRKKQRDTDDQHHAGSADCALCEVDFHCALITKPPLENRGRC